MDEYQIDQLLLDKQVAIQAAARMANALRDINNMVGEWPEVAREIAKVESDIDEYSGLQGITP